MWENWVLAPVAAKASTCMRAHSVASRRPRGGKRTPAAGTTSRWPEGLGLGLGPDPEERAEHLRVQAGPREPAWHGGSGAVSRPRQPVGRGPTARMPGRPPGGTGARRRPALFTSPASRRRRPPRLPTLRAALPRHCPTGVLNGFPRRNSILSGQHGSGPGPLSAARVPAVPRSAPDLTDTCPRPTLPNAESPAPDPTPVASPLGSVCSALLRLAPTRPS